MPTSELYITSEIGKYVKELVWDTYPAIEVHFRHNSRVELMREIFKYVQELKESPWVEDTSPGADKGAQ